MPRAIVEPTLIKKDPIHGDEYAHPAFGQIAVFRTSGAAHLYGSDFTHQHYMTIRVHESTLNRNLSEDWPHARGTLVEVALSEAQWATFVSSINMGAGVQCTIQAREGNPLVPELPAPDRKAQFENEAKQDLAEIETALKALRAKVAENTVGLTKAKAADLLGHVDTAIRRVNDSLPFVAKQMDEHMEKTVERAKVEVHGYISQQIQHAELAALGERAELLSLPDSSPNSSPSAHPRHPSVPR